MMKYPSWKQPSTNNKVQKPSLRDNRRPSKECTFSANGQVMIASFSGRKCAGLATAWVWATALLTAAITKSPRWWWWWWRWWQWRGLLRITSFRVGKRGESNLSDGGRGLQFCLEVVKEGRGVISPPPPGRILENSYRRRFAIHRVGVVNGRKRGFVRI